ncbi:dienelactone hydrolase family protein [Aquabacterium humicola]|uniref:dienelactone hydrolase family protein n=1 Tax=Aquabacterium humicola TaxID=3237377 RepID=UPI0025432485|nr:alpha/beta hydrolase [Rubrivivax pictus]
MPASPIPHPTRPPRSGLALAALAVASWLGACASGPPPAPAGTTQGRATAHTAASRDATLTRAQLALPAAVTGGEVYLGPWSQQPATRGAQVPVVVFLHGSSGLGLKAIADWQRWLAGLGIASVAPDSFALPDRLVYQSPIERAVYERLHALRASEIDPALQALRRASWADHRRLLLAGTSEGAVAVARHDGAGFAGRLLYAWSCEDNYFVDGHRTALAPALPVLNVISSSDPYFSPRNTWLGNAQAAGHCARALDGHPRAAVLLIPGAPHTLLNLPAARDATAAFVHDVLRP